VAAYIVFMREKMRDPESFGRYMEAVPPTLAGHPVKPLAIYGHMQMLEGAPLEGAVIAEFKDWDSAMAWYNSPAYREAREFRFKAGDYRVFITEGLPPG
jgi:uncharacterized protein (DUF1330 family)